MGTFDLNSLIGILRRIDEKYFHIFYLHFKIDYNFKVHSLVLKRVDSIYYLIKMIIGAVAQLGERSVRNAEVVGSIPIGST